ncbi:MAG: PIN domain-containing protein, partial [Rhodobacteraceae bacterium]|nr:PIN domain-containing protein [Paracoccaceae bacterium]MCB2141818.1 PIN domain-containing protein [Paracoccaceae bacterium]MCB2150272.1 PIN domain-containing protein [Paracoccaceae bacterium]MCB2158193.1 PIN domain-containing protein [Paracoccaceae bacterium]
FPGAAVAERAGLAARLHLPDTNDIHVLAAAIAGGADAIVTFNAADFPRHTLAEEGIARLDPDRFLFELWQKAPDQVATAVERVRARAEALSGEPQPLRALLKRAKLPRLGKALAAAG